jgi:protein translocase SecG subunit
MFKLVWFVFSILIIFLILIRTPNNNTLLSFETKTNLFESPNSSEKFLNQLTISLIVIYFILAIKFNL